MGRTRAKASIDLALAASTGDVGVDADAVLVRPEAQFTLAVLALAFLQGSIVTLEGDGHGGGCESQEESGHELHVC